MALDVGVEPTPRALALRLRAALATYIGHPSLMRRGQWLRARCLVGIGEETVLLDIDHGNLTLHDALPPLATWYFSVRGSVQAWDGYWRDPPAAGWHDLFALVKCQEMRIEGNLHGLMANLQFFKDLLALPRTTS